MNEKIEFEDTPFHLEIENISTGWGHCIVHIFEDNKKIGQYERNYRFLKTFYPFQHDGEWYALYSKCYTATRVMKLPSCEDWCGEEISGGGFCPVEYYVPYSMKYTYITKDGEKGVSWLKFDNEKPYEDKGDRECLIKDSKKYCNFGFLSGCIWGDDSSWKIQYLDFSNLKDKKLVREELFGYLELPDGFTLRECVKLDDSYMEDGSIWGVNVISSKFFNLKYKERNNEK